MKILKSKKMRSLLKRGLRKAKKTRPPNDGYFVNLIYENAANGWRYQVEYLRDSRFYDKPQVIVYGFKPPVRGSAMASHVLQVEL